MTIPAKLSADKDLIPYRWMERMLWSLGNTEGLADVYANCAYHVNKWI